MSTPIRYRGYTIAPHGRRWRVQVRPQPIVRESVEAIKSELDARITARDRKRALARGQFSVHPAGPGHVTVAELCEQWFAWKSSRDNDEPIRRRKIERGGVLHTRSWAA